MNFKEPSNEIPTAKGSEKKANLAKDDKIKSYWNRLVDEWLKFSAKSPEKDDSKTN